MFCSLSFFSKLRIGRIIAFAAYLLLPRPEQGRCHYTLVRQTDKSFDTIISPASLRVSTCWLYQCISRFYPSFSFCFLDHSQGDAVFDASSGIKVFEFCIYGSLYTKALRYLIQLDHGCVPNLLGDRVHYHWRYLGLCESRHLGEISKVALGF